MRIDTTLPIKYSYSAKEIDKKRRRGEYPSYPIFDGFVNMEIKITSSNIGNSSYKKDLSASLLQHDPAYLFHVNRYGTYIISARGLWIFDGDTNRYCPPNGEPNILGVDNALEYIKTFLDSNRYHKIEKILFQIV